MRTRNGGMPRTHSGLAGPTDDKAGQIRRAPRVQAPNEALSLLTCMVVEQQNETRMCDNH
eukprot:10700227-Karenia_brevis.AAC.1